ncbi:s4 domain-containing protein [Hirsutella rhossiliensis]|uniref:S4 domain-containing protein n=1 Tax=Hirsutella rhossiliensis TaxID=111463 RepID=A0A9P8N089_9HYPO|nr:s4 domain-containing protein [Hirsutella rhossiliensis]KAH0964517.1 s4 domain-containing protein [Hirsutella rhossiliensis]
MRKPHRFFSLSRPKLRQSWNKFNLYNLSRDVGREPQVRGSPTFFQQKWQAKSKTRAYHGEHIPEKKWYLAAHDGSEQAAGRGSGLTTTAVTAESYSNLPNLAMDDEPTMQRANVNKLLSIPFAKMTPYMQMTFAPLERRLDTAVFRALFASSVRQARQFVIHGAVKVNGKKMVHPSYQLNPGDMFQVDVEKVLYGTGQQKKANGNQRLRENLDPAEESEQEDGASEGDGAAGKAEGETAAGLEIESLTAEETWKMNSKTLKYLLKDVKKILENNRQELTAKEKKALRLFRADVRRFLARPDDSATSVEELLKELQMRMKSHELMRESFDKLVPKLDNEESSADQEQPQHTSQRQIDKGLESLSEEQKEKAKRIMGSAQLTRDEMRKLSALLKSDEENPVDDSKPYATPWRPRPFMSAFAFVPRYLEVNPDICAAVYLRHPVARKGMAEVPTPFSYLTSQLAHNWYLERG